MPPVSYLGEFEQLVLLAVLQAGAEAYTVPIRRVLHDRAGRRVARGALYTGLDRLEAKRLLRSHLSDPVAARGGRPRRYYAVTPAGLAALRGARSAFVNLTRGLEGVLEQP
jgi:DNA-binding PadR family transcriptional regulator